MKKFTILLAATLGISSLMAQNPTFAWINNVAYSTNDEIINCMDEDDNTNLYIAGKSLNGTTYFNNGDSVLGDFTYHGFLAKTDSNGLVIWSKEFDYLAQHGVSSIKVGVNNTFFVAGRTEQPAILDGVSIPDPSIYIFKYDLSGSLLDHVEYECTNSVFGLQDMAVDQNNNVYITGHFNGSLNDGATTIASGGGIYHFKFDANLNQKWFQNFSGFTYDLEIANDGHVLAVGDCPSSAQFGSFNGGSTGYTNPFLVKLDSANGNPLFLQTPTSYNGGEAKTVVQDDNDNIYIGGWFGKSNNQGSISQSTMDFGTFTIVPRPWDVSPTFVIRSGFVAKYSPSGIPQWAKVTGNHGSGHVRTLTNFNNVITVYGETYHTGLFENANDSLWIYTFNENIDDGGSKNNFFAKIDDTGNWLTARPNAFSTEIEEFLQTSTGSIYIAGAFHKNYKYSLTDSVTHAGNSLYSDGFIAKLGDISLISVNAPSNLQINSFGYSGGFGSFNMGWTDNSNDEHGFALIHSYSSGGNILGEKKIGENITNSSVNYLYVGTSYDVTAYAYKYDMLSAPSNIITDVAKNTTGINEHLLYKTSLTLYPNPSFGIVNVKANTMIENIDILNLMGQSVFQEKVMQKNFNTNLNYLPKGIYLINTRFKEGIVTQKLVLK
ncbi:MAG: T9SS type A sorting domain-containing protein [Vicingaceae bacterium]